MTSEKTAYVEQR